MSVRRDEFYKLLGPRLTICVSTISADGAPNLAPFSFVTPLSFDPPLVGVSVGKGKDTILNARETGEFVVSPMTKGWMEKGVQSEAPLKREESEFEAVGLRKLRSKKVRPPSVEESPINIECKYWNDFETGDHIFLVGEVVHIESEEDALKDGRINLEELGAVGHITGEDFSIMKKVIKIRRR